MGRVLGPFGVKGWVKVACFTDSPGSLQNFPGWWVAKGKEAGKQAGRAADRSDQDWSLIEVAESAVHLAHMVVRFQGCDSPEAAMRFRGCEVAVPRDELPRVGENEFYQSDLIGLEVWNLNDEPLGIVAELFSNGAHEVLRLREEAGERLLPYIESVVKAVDLGTGRMLVDWGKDW
jgi:16S rRNA processing protein RimM